jgi:hypothetical protein
MPSVYDTLTAWARRTTTSFAELITSGFDREDGQAPEGGGEIYRLKHWPHLPSGQKTADIYRTLSVMSNRPVNRRWILASSRMRPEQVDKLLERLVAEGAVEVIDSSRFTDQKPPA